jgi:signal peptidase I
MTDDHVLREETHGTFEKKSNEYSSLILYSIIAFALAFTVRFFIAAPYLVQGASMDPTFHSTDYLIVDRISYRLEEPERGDVVIFRFPQDPSRSFIKRVIGLPGETIEMSGQEIRIINANSPKGFVIDESYIETDNKRVNNLVTTLGEDEYFVLGDNRNASADSRVWGSLPRDHIVGRALVRLYPFTQIKINPGSAVYENN